MSLLEETRPLPRPARLFSERLAVVAPTLVVLVVLGFLIGGGLRLYQGNPTGFTVFGSRFLQDTHPPVGALHNSPNGYDGQFYWIEARDPLLLLRSTFADMKGPGAGYHFQRPAYPALAYLLAGGQESALPWTMLLVNVMAILGVTATMSVYCRRRGWSPLWALAIGLMPGLLMAALRDLTDPLATVAAVGGLIAWSSSRRWWSALLLSVAVLSREPLGLAVVGVAAETSVQAWKAWPDRPALRRIWARSWPAMVLPVLSYLLWQVYIRLQTPAIPGTAPVGATGPPQSPSLTSIWERVHSLLGSAAPQVAYWELVYLVLIIVAAVAALRLAARGSAAGVAALLMGATLLIIDFGDQWGLTRYSAPLFAMVLVGGLERGSRLATRVCAAAAAMTICLPWVISF
jgi:hypothetical protein